MRDLSHEIAEILLDEQGRGLRRHANGAYYAQRTAVDVLSEHRDKRLAQIREYETRPERKKKAAENRRRSDVLEQTLWAQIRTLRAFLKLLEKVSPQAPQAKVRRRRCEECGGLLERREGMPRGQWVHLGRCKR